MQDLTGVMESKINPNRINHPLTAERLNNIKSQIENKDIKYNTDTNIASQKTHEYELVRAKLIGYLDAAKSVLEKYPYLTSEMEKEKSKHLEGELYEEKEI